MSPLRSLAAGIAGTIVVAVAVDAMAETVKQQKTRNAAQLVEQALVSETEGGERAALMRVALKELPGYAPALWQTGHVQVGRTWVNFDDTAEVTKRNATLSRYLAERDRTPGTAAGQLVLAKWCFARGLPDQARAHLTQVLSLQPTHAEARRLLGDWFVNGRWVSAEDADRYTEQTESDAASLARWSPIITKLCDDLTDRGHLHRRAAEQRFRAIKDPAAIAALDEAPFTHSESAAGLAVAALAPMSEPRATKALARYAVHSPWESVRQEAAAALRPRHMDSYVPLLLTALSTPLVATARAESVPGGYVLSGVQYKRERQYHEESISLNSATMYIRQPQSSTPPAAPSNTEIDDMAKRLAESAVADENNTIERMNQRIIEALRTATGQRGLNTPADCWKWWNEQNDVTLSSTKPVRNVAPEAALMLVRNEYRLPDILEQPELTPTPPPVASLSTYRPFGECLVAGTPVWTDRGAVAVERIRIGDRVLSKDPASGRLEFKPVLNTTIRDPGELTRIDMGGEAIRTSGGHPFWVSGQGWLSARDIQPGMRLHTVTGAVVVDSVKTDGNARTYNLVVADYHTYFAGKEHLLTHDITIRRGNGVSVPGLRQRSSLGQVRAASASKN